jgi:hypothetical protein
MVEWRIRRDVWCRHGTKLARFPLAAKRWFDAGVLGLQNFYNAALAEAWFAPRHGY